MKTPLRLAALATLLLSAGIASADANLYQNEFLYPGQQITSSCFYRLVMQPDGNLVLYEDAKPLWASNTVGRGAYAAMQADGNLVVYNWSHQAVWSTRTHGNPGARLVLQGDRNLVLYSTSGRALWASNTRDSSDIGVARFPCNWKSVKTNGYNGWDLPGGDVYYHYFTGGTQYWCGYYCSTNADCIAYTFVPRGYQDPTYARCWIKTSIPTGYQSAPSDFFSGRILVDEHYEGNW